MFVSEGLYKGELRCWKNDCSPRFRTRRPEWGFWEWGMSGCPWPGPSAARVSASWASTLTLRKSRSSTPEQSYIKHIPASTIRNLLGKGLFQATCDPKALRKCDALLICVPTPLSKMRDPDMTYVVKTTETIASQLQRGQLVVLESTTYPGTTREVCIPILETSGLKVSKDFLLAFSPEREDPGREDFTTETITKVVGGHDRASMNVAAALYGAAIAKVKPVTSCDIAEAAKIVENVYRCVNIAMVNELKMLFERMGIDIWEVIEAAKTQAVRVPGVLPPAPVWAGTASPSTRSI